MDAEHTSRKKSLSRASARLKFLGSVVLVSLCLWLPACSDDAQEFKNKTSYYSVAIPEGWTRDKSQLYGDIFTGPKSGGFSPSMTINSRNYSELLYMDASQKERVEFDARLFGTVMAQERQNLLGNQGFELKHRGEIEVGGLPTPWVHYQYTDASGQVLEIKEFFICREVKGAGDEADKTVSLMVYTVGFSFRLGEMALHQPLIDQQLNSISFLEIPENRRKNLGQSLMGN